MKKFSLFFTTALFLMCGNAMADNVISVKSATGDADLKVASGNTVEADIYLDNTDENLTTFFQFYLTLPEGFELDGAPVFNQDRSTSGGVDMTWDSTKKLVKCKNDGDAYDLITGTSGKLFTLKIKATDAVKESSDPYLVEITNCLIGNEDFDDVKTNDLTIKIYVGDAAAETETVTLTKEYNTYVPAKDLDFTGLDIKAYYVTEVTSTEATLTEATTVAAGEGIILKGTADAEYEVPVATEAVTPNADNLLATSGIAEGDYILYDGVFVPCSGGTLPDGKAFLPASAITSGAKVISLVFGGESTGINEIQKAETEGAIYNLSGMRVSKTQKGVYIMNGRKVIVK